MYLFSSLHSPVLNRLVQFMTMFGEQILLIAVSMLVFWCIDRRKGFAAVFSLLSANVICGLMKVFVRFPRPWTVLEDLDVVRMETATGYSFPSGHTANAASFYGAAAFLFKKTWLKIVAAVLILLVCFSRMYLCVHWPVDVLGGLVFGLLAAVFVSRFALAVQDNVDKYSKALVCSGVISLAIGFVLAVFVQNGTLNAFLYADMYKIFSMTGAALICFVVEKKHIDFTTDGSAGLKVLRYVAGMAGALAIYLGIKKLCPDNAFISYARYALTAFWAFLAFPWLGKRTGLFKSVEHISEKH